MFCDLLRPVVAALLTCVTFSAVCQQKDSLSFAQQKNISFFLDISRETNPALFEVRNQLLSNRIDSQLAIAGNRFQVTGAGNGYYAPIIRGYGYDEAITNGQQLSAIVALNKQLYNKRNLSLQINALKLQGDSLRANVAINIQDVRKGIIAQYILTYADQLQVQLNNELISLLSREDTILRILTRKNVYKQADYLSFLVTLQQQELSKNQAMLQLKADYGALNYLAGIEDTTISILADPDIVELQQNLGESSPFLVKFKTDSLRLANEHSIIDINYRPKVSFFADGGLQTTFAVSPYRNFGASAGLSLNIPIYNGHQRQLQHTKLNIEERTRQKQRDYFLSQYRQQIMQLRQQLSALDELSGPVNRQISYLQTLIDVNGKLLETGDITISDYVLALNNYINSRNLLVQNQVARWQLLNQLNYWNANFQNINY